MTSLALIPPIPHLDLSERWHLLLAHLCGDSRYLKFYRERSLRGDHLILDNSAYEHTMSQMSMSELLALGYYIQVSEVVAPDLIMNECGTYALAIESLAFLSTNAGQQAWKRAGSPRIMVVPQVNPELQSIDSYDRHARLLMEIWNWSSPYLSGYVTLGISKNMDKLQGGWLVLFRQVVRELVRDYPIQVHVLGLPHRLQQVQKVLRENPYIRSLDTAQPFTSAINDQAISPSVANAGTLAPRPASYEETKMTPEQVVLAKQNIRFLHDYFIKPVQEVAPRALTERELFQFEAAKIRRGET